MHPSGWWNLETRRNLLTQPTGIICMDRRQFLTTAAAATLLAPGFPVRSAPKRRVVNDFSGLNAVPVAMERRPITTEEASDAIGRWPGAISIGGGRYIMGGQIAAPDSLHLDMRGMNRVLTLDPARRVVRVQAGISWRDLQEAIDPHDLSVRIMQSYSNFTVGGSVSVNCHGRYVGKGPLVNSVRAVQMVRADGQVLELAPESALFRGLFGGYGGLGVVTEVELDLDPNTRIRRVVEKVDLDRYPDHFRSKIARDPDVVLHNADLRPPGFAEPRLINWISTEEPATVGERLIPRDRDYSRNQTLIWMGSELPGGKRLRGGIEDRVLEREAIVWRNYEASLDTDALEPGTRLFSTYLLQEYFIPVGNFLPFARILADLLQRRRVNALNVSIRHSLGDSKSLLAWAPTEVFSFVLYYKQRASREAGIWTRKLIDAALANGGRYYLPYRLHAARSQFEQAYSEIREFVAMKARVDPRGKFQNLLWDKYL